MNVKGEQYRTIWLADDGFSVNIIDQTRLPHEFVVVKLYTDRDEEPYYSNREAIKQPLTRQGTNPLYLVMTPDGERVLKMIGYTQNKRQFMDFLRSAKQYF